MVLVWNSHATGDEAVDQQSWGSLIRAIGLNPQKLDTADVSRLALSATDLLVLPANSKRSLSSLTLNEMRRFVGRGGTIVSDGESDLSKSFDIKLSSAEAVAGAVALSTDSTPFRWADHPNVQPILSRPPASQVLYESLDSHHALAISSTFRKGRFIFFSPMFDPISSLGYSRFPDFPHVLIEELGLKPFLERKYVEAYFDPDMRMGTDFVALAKFWRRSGLRAVYAAAWTGMGTDRCDFRKLIEAAHHEGILVYAWFEFPHVDQTFWTEHPEWREKTVTQDAHVDWRYLMNFKNPDCLSAVLRRTEDLLKKFDWDGVNVAEIYFEPVEGPSNPVAFTPMNGDVRNDFKKINGFDPIALFSKASPHYWKKDSAALNLFYVYRRQLANELLGKILSDYQSLNRRENRHWEIVSTLVETLSHPEFADYLGIDFSSNLSQAEKFGASVQIEDPYPEWSRPPSRYLKLGNQIENLMPGRLFMIDVNIVDDAHEPDEIDFASAKQEGTEFLQLANCAGSGATRVCFYAESEPLEKDWSLIPFSGTESAEAEIKNGELRTSSPHSLTLHGAPRSMYSVDNQAWPCQRGGEISLPVGQHVVGLVHHRRPDYSASVPYGLLDCQESAQALLVHYDSQSRCPVTVSERPTELELDGEPYSMTGVASESGFVILAPPGNHQLKVKFN